jgi:hypothetical protein
MIKKYNQFIKRINEAGEEQAPVITPTTTPAPTETPSTTPDKRRERYTIQKPSVDPDPLAVAGEGVEDSLEYLHDTLEGSELMNNILKYQGHEITLPSETEQFEVDGVRKIKQEGNKLVPTSSAEDVIDYLNNPEAQAQAQGAQAKRSQAQRGSQSQAQLEESVDYTMGRTENQLPNPPEEILLDTEVESEEEFETQTGKDPESEALAGEKVDIDQIGQKREAQFESKSYKSRFRTKL